MTDDEAVAIAMALDSITPLALSLSKGQDADRER